MTAISNAPPRIISPVGLMTDAIDTIKARAERVVSEGAVLANAGSTQLKRIALLKNRTDAVAVAELGRADAEREKYIARNNELEAEIGRCGEWIDALRAEIPKAREPGWKLTFGSPVEAGLREYLYELQRLAKEPAPASIPFPNAARKQAEYRKASIHALIGLLTRKDLRS